VAYNPDLATATSMAPQLGTLTTSTTPTLAQANLIWAGAYDAVRIALLSNGISDSFTSSSIGEGWAQRAEMYLASGEILMAKGSIGVNAESTAPALLKMGEAMLQSIPDIRQVLIDNGGSEDAGGKDSRMGSHWLRAKDPEWDQTPGGDDVPYAAVPVFPDNSDL
jgi:hypothetical protein